MGRTRRESVWILAELTESLCNNKVASAAISQHTPCRTDSMSLVCVCVLNSLYATAYLYCMWEEQCTASLSSIPPSTADSAKVRGEYLVLYR